MSPVFPVARLDRWYAAHKRDLPWRALRSPYRTWLSEIMLQQTQVQSVVGYFERFTRRFPDFRSLARASEDEVLELWSGLGYYSRARNLLKAARSVADEHGGRLPDDPESLRRLPGIGPYTAGAILSIAFDRPEPILDGNVRRVLSRFSLETSQARLWEAAREIVERAHGDGIRPGDFNQALMELGALVCLPRDPQCGACPLASSCLARKKGLQAAYPAPVQRPETLRRLFGQLVVRRSPARGAEKFLIRRRPKTERWLKGMWEFPMVPLEGEAPPRRWAEALRPHAESIARSLGCAIEIQKPLGTVDHTITRHRLKILVVEARAQEAAGRPERLPRAWRWAEKKALDGISHSTILRKTLALLG